MKRTIIYICFVTIITIVCCIYSEELVTLYYDTVRYLSGANTELKKNDYFREYDFIYVQNTVNYKPKNKQDITNLFYTIINSGQDSFTFYCSIDYDNCLNDVKSLASDQTLLSHINNFAHPYNGFKHVEIQYTTNGEVSVLVNKSYTEEDIKAINNRVNTIYNTIIDESDNVREKIRAVHDYIINNSKYDSARSVYNVINYKSDIAFGAFID